MPGRPARRASPALTPSAARQLCPAMAASQRSRRLRIYRLRWVRPVGAGCRPLDKDSRSLGSTAAEPSCRQHTFNAATAGIGHASEIRCCRLQSAVARRYLAVSLRVAVGALIGNPHANALVLPARLPPGGAASSAPLPHVRPGSSQNGPGWCPGENLGQLSAASSRPATMARSRPSGVAVHVPAGAMIWLPIVSASIWAYD